MSTVNPQQTPQTPISISTTTLRALITHTALINHLRTTLPPFSGAVQSPLRHTHRTSPNSSLLLMPSWSSSPSSLPYTGIKIVTHHPNNSALNLPGVHAIYVLFSSTTGQPLASIDATELTLYRTASISALASSYLSKNDSETLIMVGAGSLAPHLIRAHLTVRPTINRVIIWNRTLEKAMALAHQMSTDGFGDRDVRFESSQGLANAVRIGDVISCATNSEIALVRGVDLKKGAHLDLVGSFTPSMKECDDEALLRGRVFVDSEAALVESGELIGAFERGVMKRDEIAGGLVGLIRGEKVGRVGSDEVTIFKSVGLAVVDLLSAQMVYENYVKKCSEDD